MIMTFCNDLQRKIYWKLMLLTIEQIKIICIKKIL